MDYALLDVEGGTLGASNATTTVAIWQFSHSPLPAPPNINIGIPRSTHTPQPPQSHGSPIILGGGTWFCCAPEPLMPMSLGIAMPSPYPPFPPHTYPYSVATISQSLPPLFFNVRESNSELFLSPVTTPLPWKWAPTPPAPTFLSHWHLVLSYLSQIIRLETQGPYPVCRQHPWCPPSTPMPTEPSLWAAIFLFLKILSTWAYVLYLIFIISMVLCLVARACLSAVVTKGSIPHWSIYFLSWTLFIATQKKKVIQMFDDGSIQCWLHIVRLPIWVWIYFSSLVHFFPDLTQ